MALKPKFSEEKFRVTLVDGVNEDGKKRQELLEEFSDNASSDNILQFHRANQVRDNGHQVIDIMVNDQKIGELDDDDYIRYGEHIHSARKGRIQIYEEELEDGNISFTCDAYITIPYVNSEEEKAKIRKRTQVIYVILIAIFMFYGIKGVIQGSFMSLVFAILISGAFVYFGFIRDPHKGDAAYQFVATGKKKKSV